MNLVVTIPDDLPGQGVPLTAPTGTKATSSRRNYSMYLHAAQDDWRSLTNEDEMFPQQVATLLSSFVLLPRSQFQLPIALSYLMLPSVACSSVPILFSHGLSGSGKSAIGAFNCQLQGTKPISSGSTFASIRNAIKQQRWHPESWDEKYCSIVWEDVSPLDLNSYEGRLFSLLKNGIDRSGTITIAGENGVNIEFPIFSPKLISSVHPLYSVYAFRELVRRLIVLQHKPVQHWVASDYDDSTRDCNSADLIDVNDLDWDGFSFEFIKYWDNHSNMNRFAQTSKEVGKVKGHGIPKPLFKISRELIACGVTCGYFETIAQGVTHFAQYWKWHKENVENQSSALQKLLKLFIREKGSKVMERNDMLRKAGQAQFIEEVEINPKELKDYVAHCMAMGEVEPGTGQRDVNEAMLNLGWKLNVNKSGRTNWMSISV